jgi:hypothetical protein
MADRSAADAKITANLRERDAFFEKAYTDS